MRNSRVSTCLRTKFLTKRTGKYQKKSNTSSEMMMMMMRRRRRIGLKINCFLNLLNIPNLSNSVSVLM
jgi:hypothetical protein